MEKIVAIDETVHLVFTLSLVMGWLLLVTSMLLMIATYRVKPLLSSSAHGANMLILGCCFLAIVLNSVVMYSLYQLIAYQGWQMF